jgi:DNA processing protein
MDDETSATEARLDKHKELSHWLALLHAPGIGSVTLARLLEQYATPEGVLAAAATGELQRLALIKENSARFLADPDWSLVENDLAWLQAGPDRHILTRDSQYYPDLLREIADPPPILFVHGNVDLLNSPQLAIVGSRNPTPLGLEMSRDFAHSLAVSGLTITSGLALGVDAAAHAGALAGGGTTVAVTGTGLDRVYPASHRRLAHQIAAHGVLVSEFPPGTPPRPDHFPRRNRIISGLSLGTLVTEAAPHSGSLITARLAAEQGREVFAIPGSIHNPLARGCHHLLRNGAKLVEEIYDIIEELVQFMPVDVRRDSDSDGSVPRDHGLDQRQQKVIQNLGFEPTSVDTLIERTGFTADILTTTLLALELAGLVATAPGGFYMRRTNQ